MDEPEQRPTKKASAARGGRGAATSPPAPATPELEDDHSPPISLVGYLREPDVIGVRRLYQSPTSENFVQIALGDIVDPPQATAGLQPGQIVIWIRGDAKVHLLVELDLHNAKIRATWPRH